MEQTLFDSKMQNLPFTIAVIKPDTCLEEQRLASIIKGIEEGGQLVIRNIFQRQLVREEIINLLYRHEQQPYFEDLLMYMRSGECCVMVLTNAPDSQGDPIAKWKNTIGPMNPEEAKKSHPDSLRAKYGTSIIKNEFHGSDNLMQANKERNIFNLPIPQLALTEEQLNDPKGPYATMNRKKMTRFQESDPFGESKKLVDRPKTHQLTHTPLQYPPSIVDKPRRSQIQENLVIERQLHRNLTKVCQVGEKGVGIREAVSMLRPYNEGRHGSWDNYSGLYGNSVKGSVGGEKMSKYLSNQK